MTIHVPCRRTRTALVLAAAIPILTAAVLVGAATLATTAVPSLAQDKQHFQQVYLGNQPSIDRIVLECGGDQAVSATGLHAAADARSTLQDVGVRPALAPMQQLHQALVAVIVVCERVMDAALQRAATAVTAEELMTITGHYKRFVKLLSSNGLTALLN